MTGTVVVTIIAANALLLAIAAADRSWTAAGIALLYGPIANSSILIISLGCSPLVKRLSGGDWIGRYQAVAFFLPIAAAIFDLLVILAMGLHGC